MADETQTREQEIREIWKKHGLFLRLLRGGVLIGIGFLLGLLFFAEPQAREGYMVNVFTSVLGLGATALIFDELNRKRSEDDLKRQLVMDAASTSNEKAKDAVHQLRRRGWLTGEGGLLQKADLGYSDLHSADLLGANLQGASFVGAKLQGADLTMANLQDVRLWKANLSGAYLNQAQLQRAMLNEADVQGTEFMRARLQEASLYLTRLQGAKFLGAKMQRAVLTYASLQGADLREANLEGADLSAAYLEGADLSDANLEGANIRGMKVDAQTRFPDGSYWTSGKDLRCFTDRSHPNFWRSDYVASPAYRGKTEA